MRVDQAVSRRRGVASPLPLLALVLTGVFGTLVLGGGHGSSSGPGAPSAQSAPLTSAGSVVYIPASAHAAGANGANWTTDVEVHNPGSGTASSRSSC